MKPKFNHQKTLSQDSSTQPFLSSNFLKTQIKVVPPSINVASCFKNESYFKNQKNSKTELTIDQTNQTAEIGLNQAMQAIKEKSGTNLINQKDNKSSSTEKNNLKQKNTPIQNMSKTPTTKNQILLKNTCSQPVLQIKKNENNKEFENTQNSQLQKLFNKNIPNITQQQLQNTKAANNKNTSQLQQSSSIQYLQNLQTLASALQQQLVQKNTKQTDVKKDHKKMNSVDLQSSNLGFFTSHTKNQTIKDNIIHDYPEKNQNQNQSPVRIDQQNCLKIVLVYNSQSVKLSFNKENYKIQHLLDFLYQELTKLNIKQQVLDHVTGFKTANSDYPLDLILTQPQINLSIFNNNQSPSVLLIEPFIDNHSALKPQPQVNLHDFEFLRCIGMGGFSHVYLARHKINGQFYALKLIDKEYIHQNQKHKIIQNERDIMMQLKHPFLIKLEAAFETQKFIVFVLEFCSGGELFFLLRQIKKMNEQQAAFYFAEICLGMFYLHKKKIIYRDIKPENILLDKDGHIRIADFGLSKPNMESEDIAYSFCGSPEYMAPEMLLKAGHNFQLDLYCLGALLYELVIGLPPYYSKNTDKIYNSILSESLSFPENIKLSSSLKNLLISLLVKNPSKRIGVAQGIQEILQHPWMSQIDLLAISTKKIQPPFKPKVFKFNFDEVEFSKGENEFIQNMNHLQMIKSNLLISEPKLFDKFYFEQFKQDSIISKQQFKKVQLNNNERPSRQENKLLTQPNQDQINLYCSHSEQQNQQIIKTQGSQSNLIANQNQQYLFLLQQQQKIYEQQKQLIQETIDKGIKNKPEIKKDKMQSPPIMIKKHERMATLNEFYHHEETEASNKFSQSNKRLNTEIQYIKAMVNSKKSAKI